LDSTSAQPVVSPADLLGCHAFFGMNTRILLLSRAWDSTELLCAAEQVFHGVEERFSRFRPSSELSRLNDMSGHTVIVSPEMFHLLDLCRRFHRLSGGLFDPAILPDLESAGYDRSFELVPSQAPEATPTNSTPANGSIADLAMDRSRRAVQAPPTVRLDLGGIGKGYAVDRAAQLLAPAADFLIDAGGDIFASGDGPDGDGWLVAVANPLREDEDLGVVRLRGQALATSTVTRRRWQRDGRWLHHLIDPRTGEPALSDALSVSVIAASAVEADVFAKVALLLGVEVGERFLDARGAEGLFALSDGSWQATREWPGG
jgi:thiamine biosynthesis lipoprotein